MAPDLIIIGQATVDDVVPARPGPWRRRIGGNALYAAAGARLWLAPERIGVVTRAGRGFPFDLDALLARAGVSHHAIARVTEEHLIEWLLYEADGSRRSVPRNRDLQDAGGEGAGDAAAYLARLEAQSPTVGDIPEAWLPARAVYLAPQVAARHGSAVRALRQRTEFLSVDPSPHYSAGLSAEALGRMLAGTNALLPSEQEVGHLAAACGGWEAAVARLRAAGFPEVAVKLGAAEVLVGWADGELARIQPPKAEVRDPTGAGDAFCGAYAACRLQDMAPPEAARRAVAAAALVVACEGADAALSLSSAEAKRGLASVP